MKITITLLTLILTMSVFGCNTNKGRFDPSARMKRTHEKQLHDGDNLGRRIHIAEKRILEAVKNGKMTPEQGEEMIDALRKKVRDSRKRKKDMDNENPNNTNNNGHNRQRGMRGISRN